MNVQNREKRKPALRQPGWTAWLIALVSIPALYAEPSANPVANPDREQAQQQYRIRLTATRTAYFKVVTSNDPAADAEAHAALAAMERAYPGDAVATAYRGSLELLDVAHSWAIWNLHRQAADGLSLLDRAVSEAPNEPEARFIRAATDWHLPGFYHRRAQCEEDFAWLAARAEDDARNGKMPLELAAATYNYWGQILVNRGDSGGARKAFETALRVAPQSPGGVDAGKRLVRLR